MEMKHNSAIKQLMREFNTQMASREQELDAAVKEAIGEPEEKSCSIHQITVTINTAVS